jgi:enoyl-CoA hydratase/carnithine racemase
VSDDPVRLDVGDDGVATVSLARPQLNIFDLAMRDAFIEAVTAVRDHPDARAVVLRAEGSNFSAGADLREFGSAEHPLEARRIRWDRDPWGPLWDLPQPTVAALHGHAVGAGLEMALLCDLRLGAPDSRLGLPETRLGMLPAAGGTQTLSRLVGAMAALPPILTAATMDADEALRSGLLHSVADDVDDAAHRWAVRLAALDPPLAAAARRALHAAGDLPLDAGLATERQLARWCAGTGRAGHRPPSEEGP